VVFMWCRLFSRLNSGTKTRGISQEHILQVKHDGAWIRRLSALSKLYFTPTFLGAEYIDASRPAMYVGNHSMYGIFDSPMLIDYLYNEHKVARSEERRVGKEREA